MQRYWKVYMEDDPIPWYLYFRDGDKYLEGSRKATLSAHQWGANWKVDVRGNLLVVMFNKEVPSDRRYMKFKINSTTMKGTGTVVMGLDEGKSLRIEEW